MSDSVTVRVLRLAHGKTLELPQQASLESAGLDLRAALPEDGPLILEPGDRARIPTGLAAEIPVGWEGQIRPRSGLADRHGLALVNSPGTVDSDYRGEIQVLVINLGQEPVTLRRGQRIAQMVVAPVARVKMVEVEELSGTERGQGGFGSTGS